jgi:hypothetical protein
MSDKRELFPCRRTSANGNNNVSFGMEELRARHKLQGLWGTTHSTDRSRDDQAVTPELEMERCTLAKIIEPKWTGSLLTGGNVEVFDLAPPGEAWFMEGESTRLEISWSR